MTHPHQDPMYPRPRYTPHLPLVYLGAASIHFLRGEFQVVEIARERRAVTRGKKWGVYSRARPIRSRGILDVAIWHVAGREVIPYELAWMGRILLHQTRPSFRIT
jgi:hypothetical protein